MMRVYFSGTEVALCNYIGKMRHDITARHGKERKQDQSQDGLQMSINGVITEYAVGKLLNLHFDLNCDFRKFGADLISRKGASIDVKCASRQGGNLNAVVWSGDKPADVFVLTEIHHSHVRVVGWIDRTRFLIPENLKDVGNGPFYSLPQSHLIPFDEKILERTL